MELGKINTLVAARRTDFGFYLVDLEDNEVLLPNAYVSDELKISDEIDVFIFKDSEDRITATTITPKIQLEQFAYLQVKEVNKYGAFLDWGLPKDLMVPFAEQKLKLVEGNWCLVFLLEDEQTERLIGTCKVNEFVFYDKIELKPGDEVDLLLYEHDELGMKAIVNNLYRGLIFESDIHKKIKPGEKIKGFVKQVREDGKLDIALEPIGYSNQIDKNAEIILDFLNKNKGFVNLTDKSEPEDIKHVLGLSKKAFKRGLGFLYKKKTIEILDDGIKLVQN